MKPALTLIFAALLVACSNGTELNMSSPETVERSIEQIEQELEGEKHREFIMALDAVAMDVHEKLEAGLTQDAANKEMRELLHGKDADEVIEIADKLGQ